MCNYSYSYAHISGMSSCANLSTFSFLHLALSSCARVPWFSFLRLALSHFVFLFYSFSSINSFVLSHLFSPSIKLSILSILHIFLFLFIFLFISFFYFYLLIFSTIPKRMVSLFYNPYHSSLFPIST